VIRIKLTNEERNLELIGSVFCEQYQTEAKFYIERSVPLRPGFGTGTRHLVVQYGDGYTGREGLAIAANRQREFASMIPQHWSNEKLLEFLLAPSKTSTAPYPTWEVPARSHGRPVLFDFEDTIAESTVRTGRSSAL
jgi:hypothetical protein